MPLTINEECAYLIYDRFLEEGFEDLNYGDADDPLTQPAAE